MEKKWLSILALLAVVGLSSAPVVAAEPAQSPTNAKANKVQLQVPSMGTINVTGNQLHALWEIKHALNRSHSFQNPDQLVCNVEPISGSHISKRLICETNRGWWERTDLVALGLLTGQIRATNVYFTTGINYSRFRELLRSLPPEADQLTSTEAQP